MISCECSPLVNCRCDRSRPVISHTYEITWAYGLKENITATRVEVELNWVNFYGPMSGNSGSMAQLLLAGFKSDTNGIVSVRKLDSIAPEGFHS